MSNEKNKPTNKLSRTIIPAAKPKPISTIIANNKFPMVIINIDNDGNFKVIKAPPNIQNVARGPQKVSNLHDIFFKHRDPENDVVRILTQTTN